MSKPLSPERTKKLAEKLKELTRKTDDAGQAAAGELLRETLPFEDDGSGRKTATIPLPNGGRAGVSYDPSTPNDADFGFSVKDPCGQPQDVPGVRGMKDGEATLRPLEVGPAIEKASGIDKSVQFSDRIATAVSSNGLTGRNNI